MSVRRLLAKVAMLSLLAAAPLAARPLEVTISPVPAVWTERVQVTVAGLSATACGPGALSIDDPVVNVFTGNVEVDLREPCNSSGPPVVAPFGLTTSVDLEPGSYSLRVVDWALGGSSEPSSFTVYEPLIQMAVELPASSTTAAPGALTLHLVAASTPPQPQAQVDGNVVSVTVAAVDPPSYPQRPFKHVVLSIPLPELAAGTYDVRVFFGGAAARAVLSVWNAAGCVPERGDALPRRRPLPRHRNLANARRHQRDHPGPSPAGSRGPLGAPLVLRRRQPGAHPQAHRRLLAERSLVVVPRLRLERRVSGASRGHANRRDAALHPSRGLAAAPRLRRRRVRRLRALTSAGA